MEIEGVYLGSAFLAGIVSFLAPCTLPLLPAYLAYVSGVAEHELAHPEHGPAAQRKVALHGALFVLGFSVVFVLFGMLAAQFGGAFQPLKHVLMVTSGFLVLAFGLLLTGVLTLPFLARVRQVRVPSAFTVGTPFGSLALGSAFGLGWTPCIGPILGTILLLASSSETVLEGGILLGVFASGIGIPFLVLAILFARATVVITMLTPYLHVVSRIGGVVLIILGVLLILGKPELMMSLDPFLFWLR